MRLHSGSNPGRIKRCDQSSVADRANAQGLLSMTEPQTPEMPETPSVRSASSEMERLRDRTDEIELIISSLTMVALFSMPGWLFERFADSYLHLSTSLVISGSVTVMLLSGLSYALGACFLLHLLTRAYWVGLIGLRSVFPQGIDWSRTPGIGPLTIERYRQLLPDLATAINRSDRLASSLFAVISVIGLALLWILMLMVLSALIGGAIGSAFGSTNQGVLYASLGLVVFGLGASALLWLLDSVLARRVVRLREAKWFRAVVSVLGRLNGWLIPQRLVLPVQLTLQSNTRPFLFTMLFAASMVGIVLAGQFSYDRAFNFTVSDQFRYLDDSDLDNVAFRSSYYEDMRDGRDRLHGRPMIPSFEQRGTHLRLFLPYQPLRDNLLLAGLCSDEQTASGTACLQQLWQVTLAGEDVDLSRFLPAERLDLGMRGLIGTVPLSALEPGLQVLTVIWNPQAGPDDVPVDDIYTESRFDYQLPFLFAPEFEAGVRQVEAARPQAAPESAATVEGSTPGPD